MYNFNSGYGQALFQMICSRVPALGKVYVVLDPDDTDEQNYAMLNQIFKPDPDGSVRIFSKNSSAGVTPLEQAYAACESNNNDVIILDGNSTHLVTTGLAWTKNRIHVFGMDGGNRLTQQGVKIELTGAVDSAYVLKVTGVRNSFRNLKVIQSSTHANALNVIQFAGEGNLYENVSCIFGVIDNLGLTTSAEALMGEDAGTFINCSWGTDVLLTSDARRVMAFDAITGGSADGAKSNRFVDCEWIIMSSDANAVLLKIVDIGGAKFLNQLIRPRFIAVKSTGGGGIAITNAVQSVASFVDGSLVLFWPVTANCTNGCDTLTANVVIGGAPVFGAGTWEGGTPT